MLGMLGKVGQGEWEARQEQKKVYGDERGLLWSEGSGSSLQVSLPPAHQEPLSAAVVTSFSCFYKEVWFLCPVDCIFLDVHIIRSGGQTQTQSVINFSFQGQQ